MKNINEIPSFTLPTVSIETSGQAFVSDGYFNYMENEIWKDVVGYEGLYKVSNLGNVKSYKFGREKLLKLNGNSRGYCRLSLYKNDTGEMFSIHRLVAITFIENPHKRETVNHINKNPRDNRVENLEWLSFRENDCHRTILNNRSSKYIGVCWDKASGKWKSSIFHNGKSVHLGRFLNEEDAYNSRVNYENKNNIVNKFLIEKGYIQL